MRAFSYVYLVAIPVTVAFQWPQTTTNNKKKVASYFLACDFLICAFSVLFLINSSILSAVSFLVDFTRWL